jgi:chromosome segregation ATPase
MGTREEIAIQVIHYLREALSMTDHDNGCRVHVLEKRLQEKLQENEELEKQLQLARQTLSHQQQQQAKKSTAATATPSRTVTPIRSTEDKHALEEAQRRIFCLEEENQSLHRQLEVDRRKEILSLEQEIRELKLRLGGSSSSTTTTAEEILQLQQQILDRDIRIVEIQFDYSSQAGEINRLRRRLQEHESSNKTSTTMTTSPSQNQLRPGTSTGRKASAVGEDYEATIDTMKKIIEKLNSENERLRKSPAPSQPSQRGASTTTTTDTVDKKRYEKLQEELQEMKGKMKKYDDLVLKVKLHQQSIATLRKQLQAKDNELLQQQSKLQEVILDKESLERQVMEKKESKGLSAYELEIDALKQQVREQDRELDRLRRTMPSTSSSSTTRNREDSAALAKLEEENRKLKSELQAFDMDFFDEIENLKYEHAEAIRKLRIYSRKYGEIA